MKRTKSIINITDTQKKLKIDPKSVRYIVKNSIKNLYCGSYEIDIIFCSESYIKKLNKIYRDQNKPTDVLSFEIKEWQGMIFHIGEIYISPSVARRNFIFNKNFWEKAEWVISGGKGVKGGGITQYDKEGFGKEIALLLIHGILHIFGYSHDEEHVFGLDDPGYDKDMKYMQNFLYKKL